MKLLLDQNISHRLLKQLVEFYPDSNQVSLLNIGDADDIAIWEYAKKNDFCIVTLDSDFNEFSTLWQGPPFVIWLKCGNQPKKVIRDKLIKNQATIENSLKNKNVWCIEIY